MFKRIGFLLLCTALHGLATETLHPVLPLSDLVYTQMFRTGS